MAQTAPGKGGGYVARNKRPAPVGREQAFFTGKLSTCCPCGCGVVTEYYVDGYEKQKDDGKIYTLRLKAKTKAAAQPGRPAAAPAGKPPTAPTGRPSAAPPSRPPTAGGGRPPG